MNETAYSNLEKEVLGFILKGDTSTLKTLRKQFVSSKVLKRDFTGMGYFLYFAEIKEEPIIQEIKNYFCFAGADVVLKVQPENKSARFLLWIKNGYLVSLEAYVHIDDWPNKIDGFEINSVQYY